MFFENCISFSAILIMWSILKACHTYMTSLMIFCPKFWNFFPLLQNGNTFMALPQNDPSQQDFLSHKTTSSSGGESFSNSKYLDNNVSPTDAAAGRQNRTATGSSSGRSAPGSLGQTYIPNWSDIFPPPPDQPPPPAGDSPPNSPRSVVRSRQQQQVININNCILRLILTDRLDMRLQYFITIF